MDAAQSAHLAEFDVDSGDGPVYRRIVRSIADGIATGRLAAGQRLPTHRALAQQLGVAVPTVSRAYKEAEQRGLITSTVGRGTFVTGIPTLRESGERGAMRVDFSVNAPARGEHAQILRAALAMASSDSDLSSLLGYQADIGGADVRLAAANWLSRSDWTIHPDNVAICHGGQHAILVALGAVLRPGDVLLTEAMTYPGVKSAAQLLGIRIVGVEMDDDGIVPDALHSACTAPNEAPAALYCMPTAHNPTAITLSPSRREAIVDIARRYELNVIEDDVFGLLCPPDERAAPLAALAPERTLHLSSLSKTLTPGLRWGVVAAPGGLIDRVGALIRATIFNPAPLATEIATRWLSDGTAQRLLTWQRGEIRARFDIAVRLLSDCSAIRTVRTAGLHAWLALNEPWTPTEFIDAAHRLGIEIGATSYFFADTASVGGVHARGVRLCLGNPEDRDALTGALTSLVSTLNQGPTWSSGVRV